MIPLFLGLSIANLLLMGTVFGLGLFVTDAQGSPTSLYSHHISLGIAAGFLATATHLSVYTYFMATSKWLRAAADKANLDIAHYVKPAFVRKNRVLVAVMIAIIATFLTLFAGAGCDPTLRPWWPGQVHLVVAAAGLVINAGCAWVEFVHIRDQGQLMDQALAILNQPPPPPDPESRHNEIKTQSA